MHNKHITIYTDGSCQGNPGIGGWGVILKYNHYIKKVYGGEEYTTNNRMELLAIIQALKLVKYKCKISIYTDSRYVQLGITKWIKLWKQNKWKTKANKPVKNQDLWETLYNENNKHNIIWKWIKSHNNNIMNDLADNLAKKGVKSINKSLYKANTYDMAM